MPESSFDPQLSAELHNRILQHAWTGVGRDVSSLPSTTWWEESSPVPFDIASRLNPKLIQFLRLAKFDANSPEFHFFYFLGGLQETRHLLRFSFLEMCGDQFVWLYPAARSNSSDEVGIIFDQDTELAAFFPDWECISFYREQSWPRKPLQHILEAYLEMINEGTVETSSETERGLPERFFPWQFQQYTQRDIEKAVAALTRLLDAIECRLPLSTLPNGQFMDLPYSESVINEACVPNNSFIRSFLLALPVRRIQFRYIAPGIGIQSATEFIAQPFAKLLDNLSSRFDAKDSSDMPVCLFRGDGVNASPWIKPWFPDGNAQDIPSGLYTEWIHKWLADFGNQCRLLLPFGIGARGYARSSNGIQLGHHTSDRILEDVSSELYQAYYFSGFLPTQWRAVQLHKVLLNWAGRVEMGDWEVNKDGVAGGIENFTEADTPEHWKKYQVPLSW